MLLTLRSGSSKTAVFSGTRCIRKKASLDSLSGCTMMGGNPEFGGATMMSCSGCGALGLEKYEAAFRENEMDETRLMAKGAWQPWGRMKRWKHRALILRGSTQGAFVCYNVEGLKHQSVARACTSRHHDDCNNRRRR